MDNSMRSECTYTLSSVLLAGKDSMRNVSLILFTFASMTSAVAQMSSAVPAKFASGAYNYAQPASELRSSALVSKTQSRAKAGSAHDQYLMGYAYANGVGKTQDW